MRNQKDLQLFLALCLNAKKMSRLEALFDFFLTIDEKSNLAARMQIIDALLSQKLSQREISETMGVSISQITRGSNALKTIDADLLAFIEHHVRHPQNEA